MWLKLSVVFLMLLFAVMRFGGVETDVSPFVENPGAEPHNMLLAVAPLDNPLVLSDEKVADLAGAQNPSVPGSPAPSLLASAAVAALTPAPEASLSDEPEPSVDTLQAPDDLSPTLDQAAIDAAIADARAVLETAQEVISENRTASFDVRNENSLGENNQLLLDLSASLLAGEPAEVTGSAVNLRSGPSVSNDILGRAVRGDVVSWISDPVPGWALVRHPSLTEDVYMSSDFLRKLTQ